MNDDYKVLYEEMWTLLEDIDARIDLEEEISAEFAQKVRIALWGEETNDENEQL